MAFKRLYDEHSRYTDTARKLAAKTQKALQDSFDEALVAGYCPREIGALMIEEIHSMALMGVLKVPVVQGLVTDPDDSLDLKRFLSKENVEKEEEIMKKESIND